MDWRGVPLIMALVCLTFAASAEAGSGQSNPREARSAESSTAKRCGPGRKASPNRTWVKKRKCRQAARPYLTRERAYEALWLHVNANALSWKRLGPLDRVSRTKFTSFYVRDIYLSRFEILECWMPLTASLIRGKVRVRNGPPDDPACSVSPES